MAGAFPKDIKIPGAAGVTNSETVHNRDDTNEKPAQDESTWVSKPMHDRIRSRPSEKGRKSAQMMFPWRSETKNPLWLRASSPSSCICTRIGRSQKVDRGSNLQLFQGTGVQYIISRKLGSGKSSGQYVVFQARCSICSFR
jgi:hypothetical protein